MDLTFDGDPAPAHICGPPVLQSCLASSLSARRIPLVVLKEKRKIEFLLAGNGPTRAEGAVFSTPTKRYTKVMKLDPEGNRHWTVVAEGNQKACGTFVIESDADNAIADLRSPVVSLMDLDSAPTMLPANVTLVGPGCLDLHEDWPDGPPTLRI